MTEVEIADIVKNADWIKKFNPQKRIITGKAYKLVKRLLDLIIVFIAAPLWGPVFLIIFIVVQVTSPGASSLFTQLRTGKDGKRFRMYKFRSMVANAEELKMTYAHLNELQWPDFKITNDPRITKVGKLLRKTSLDELPQLLNVIKGDMSLVGPRPTSFGSETYKLWQTERLDVTPGLTGLWQIIGRAQLEFDERLRLDIAYIERQGVLFDIVILLRTLISVFKQRGAK